MTHATFFASPGGCTDAPLARSKAVGAWGTMPINRLHDGDVRYRPKIAGTERGNQITLSSFANVLVLVVGSSPARTASLVGIAPVEIPRCRVPQYRDLFCHVSV